MIRTAAPGASVRFVLLLLVCVLSACARLPDPADGEEVEFDVVARLGMRYGDEAGSGTLSWRHSELRDEMLLTSPLGQGLAEIRRVGKSVSLVLADGRRFEGHSAEALTDAVLGFRMPIGGFADWILGRASPALPPAKMELDAEGRPRSLHQGGWRVSYMLYGSEPPGEGLPVQMRLYYPDLPESGDPSREKSVELRIAISAWRVRPAMPRRAESVHP
jgi:outer membrane lipoprotein LolB